MQLAISNKAITVRKHMWRDFMNKDFPFIRTSDESENELHAIVKSSFPVNISPTVNMKCLTQQGNQYKGLCVSGECTDCSV